METFKKYWKLLVAAIGAILGLLFLRDYFQKDLKADAKLADTKLQDAIIDKKLKYNAQAQEEVKNSTTGLVEGLKEDLKSQDDKTPEEIEQYYKKP